MSHSKSPCHFGLKGQVYWEVLDSDGRIDAKGGHPNLILDKGLDLIATNAIASMFTYCCVGTGNSTPIVSQLGLDNEKARTNNYLTSGNGCGTTYVAEGVFEMKRTFDFPLGALNSSVQGPYSEVGFSPLAAAGNNLFSRSLFKDGGGVPVTINVLPSQQLRVTYVLTVDMSLLTEWRDGSFNLSGIGQVDYKVRLAPVRDAYAVDGSFFPDDNYGSIRYARLIAYVTPTGITRDRGDAHTTLEPCMSQKDYIVRLMNHPTLHDYTDVAAIDTTTAYNLNGVTTRTGTTSATKLPYVAGDFYVDTTAHFGTNAGNYGTLNWFMLAESSTTYNRAFLMFNFPTPLQKDDMHTLTLTYRKSWGRM